MLTPAELMQGKALVGKYSRPRAGGRLTVRVDSPEPVNPRPAAPLPADADELDIEIAALEKRRRKLLKIGALRAEISSLQGCPVVGSREGKMRAKTILDLVVERYSVPLERLLSRERAEWVCLPRHIAFYLIRRLTDLSLHQVGGLFHKDHGTVMNGAGRVADLMEIDAKLRTAIEQLVVQCQERFDGLEVEAGNQTAQPAALAATQDRS